MTFRLVLDATAVAAYATGNINVGEVLAEVADEWRDPEVGPPRGGARAVPC